MRFIAKHYKRIMVVAVMVFALLALAHPTPSFASSVSDACKGVGLSSGTGGCSGTGVSLNGVLKNIMNILSAIVGVAAVIMIVIGGFRYVTSGGDTAKVASAKNTIIYAIVGLIVVAFAQVIVHFVLNSAK